MNWMSLSQMLLVVAFAAFAVRAVFAALLFLSPRNSGEEDRKSSILAGQILSRGLSALFIMLLLAYIAHRVERLESQAPSIVESEEPS